jgi:hypothetical protein
LLHNHLTTNLSESSPCQRFDALLDNKVAMIEEISRNLFEEKPEATVFPTTSVGVMGKGIALQFKQKFPADYFKAYRVACQNGELAIGSVQVYEMLHPLTQAVLTRASILKNVALRLSDFSRGFQPTVKESGFLSRRDN